MWANETIWEKYFMWEKIYSELEQKILNEAWIKYNEKKELIDLENSELHQKINIEASLWTIILNQWPTDSILAFNSLKESWCVQDNVFKNVFYNTCRENFLIA